MSKLTALEKIEELALKLFLNDMSDDELKIVTTRCWWYASEFYSSLPVDIFRAAMDMEPDNSTPYLQLIERTDAQAACSGHLTDKHVCYFFRADGHGKHVPHADFGVPGLVEDWKPSDGTIYVILKEKKEDANGDS